MWTVMAQQRRHLRTRRGVRVLLMVWIPALPLGGRIKVEPWNDQLTLLKPQAEGGAVAEYEKMPFEVAPFLVYLTRQDAASNLTSRPTVINAEAVVDPSRQ